MRRLRILGGAVCMTAAITAATAARSDAGIVLNARHSFVAASGETSADDFSLYQQTIEFGLYDDEVGDALPGAGGGTTSASARQESDVEVGAALPLSGFATGDAAAQVAELDAIAAEGVSSFTLSFEIRDRGETIQLEGALEVGFASTARVTLHDSDGNVDFQRLLETPDDGPLTFDAAVTLAPDTYHLIAEAIARGTPSPTTASFDLRFSGGDATVIPLPAGVVAGGAMLLALPPLVRRAGPRRART